MISKLIENFKNIKIAVIGDLMLDEYIMGKVERISPEAPVPVVKVTEEKFVDISNGSYPINFSDISAYSITKGQITDIKDYELNLIDGTFLDSISNNFGKIFNQLLDLQAWQYF